MSSILFDSTVVKLYKATLTQEPKESLMGPLPKQLLRSSWLPAVLAALASAAVSPRVARAAGNNYTTCANLCSGTPCVVSQTVNVIPGSHIDCGTQDVQIYGGDVI